MEFNERLEYVLCLYFRISLPKHCTHSKCPPFMIWTNKCSWAWDRGQWALNICFNLHNLTYSRQTCAPNIHNCVCFLYFFIRRWWSSVYDIQWMVERYVEILLVLSTRISHTESHQRALHTHWVFIGAINRAAAVDRTITIVIIIQYNRCVCA